MKTDLFCRGIGEATDVVGKEMYSFQDRGDRSCTLRPEGTASVLVLTEWQHYCDLDWQALAVRMRRPAWLFDARAVADPAQVKAAGINLWRIGDGED